MWNKTKVQKEHKSKKEKNKTQKYHKAVLKSICISTGYLFSNNQPKLEVCFSLQKLNERKQTIKHRMLMLKCDYIFT